VDVESQLLKAETFNLTKPAALPCDEAGYAIDAAARKASREASTVKRDLQCAELQLDALEAPNRQRNMTAGKLLCSTCTERCCAWRVATHHNVLMVALALLNKHRAVLDGSAGNQCLVQTLDAPSHEASS
jgi:hypothetical protein